MIIKRSLLVTLRGTIPDKGNAKESLAWGEKVKESDKVEIENLMSSLMNTKYDNVGGIRNFIPMII